MGSRDSTQTAAKAPPVRANSPETSISWRAMGIVTLLFFMWGLLTSLNDILVPHLKAIFELKYVEVMLIQFSFFSAYLIFAMPSGRLIEWVGYKQTIVLGLVTMGTGALLFIPRRVATGMLLGIFANRRLSTGLASVLTSGQAAMWSILLVGLFYSIMSPRIFSLALDGFGTLTS